MSNLRKIEKLTGGKATLTQQPANDFFPAPHWFLQTADGGRFGATSKRDLLASIAEFLTEQERAADADDRWTDRGTKPRGDRG